MIRLAITTIAAFCGMGVCATTWTIKDGASNWASPDSYSSGGTGVPQLGDTVEIPDQFAVSVSSDDPDSVSIVEKLGRISPGGMNATITFDVSKSKTLTMKGVIHSSGVVVKKGAGTLVFDSDGSAFGNGNDYKTYMLTIENGSVIAPQNYTFSSGGVDKWWGANYGHVSVAEGAVFKLPRGIRADKDKHVEFCSLSGAGLVTSDTADTELRLFYQERWYEETCVFEGKLDANIKLFTERNIDLTGALSVMTLAPMVYDGNGRWGGNRGTIGVRSFGKKADQSSSVGVASYLNYNVNGGTYRYLGVGEETDKDFRISTLNNNQIAVLDGGTNGALIVTGNIKPSGTPTTVQRFGFSGEGTNVNVFAGSVSSWTSSGQRLCYAFEKRGKGTWRFADYAGTDGKDNNVKREFFSPLTVFEGCVQYDSIEKAGEWCSLGKASSLPQGWAISLGEENSEGVLEYVGVMDVNATTRPIVLGGSGRLVNSTPYRARYRMQVLDAGGARTLTLAGTGSAENEIADVCDTAENPISIVKEGSGRWILSGNQDFHGNLTVRGGTLVVAAAPLEYKWFRITFKEVFAKNYDGTTSTMKGPLALRFCGFYDQDGVLQSAGVTEAIGSRASAVRVGEAGFDTMRSHKVTYTGPGHDVAKNLFAPDDSWMEIRFLNMDGTDTATPKADDPDTWIPIVICLPENSKRIYSYDFATFYGGTSGNKAGFPWNPSRWSVEGSVDGVHWENAKPGNGDFEVSIDTCPALAYDSYYVFANTKYAAADARVNEKGCAINGTSSTAYSQLRNLGSISVAPNSTLKIESGVTGKIRSLSLDVAGAGTIDGAWFDDSGTIEIKGCGTQPTTDFVVPVKFTRCTGLDAFVENWSLKLDGTLVSSDKYSISLTEEGVLVHRVRNGLLMLLR